MTAGGNNFNNFRENKLTIGTKMFTPQKSRGQYGEQKTGHPLNFKQ